ncbi:Uncharacterized protein TPAR_06379 [Tolypocladium paradoxum]|uniref:Uncharacterized protein n=1 Tax=Tolypocladium paradoxum TaxID=94208 RepID=A0A2S4KTD0_9HYPO|nr:Uncharacterized protein TPAR_06379 [Tolypocladium paradoxum]
MPELRDITYSQEAAVAAVRGYYAFLSKMYLMESFVLEPPKDGWPFITAENMRALGKTDKVISLLRHLPYISSADEHKHPEAVPKCVFADWQSIGKRLPNDAELAEEARVVSENASFYQHVPPHVISLTYGPEDDFIFLLDTELGIVHWVDAGDKIRFDPSREPISDDAYDYAPEDEADAWRGNAPAWAIPNFFELLKDQYRRLHFVPVSPWQLYDTDAPNFSSEQAMLAMVQDIYRQHGWPDMEQYRKEDCLRAVHNALEEQYPDGADSRFDE